MSRCELVTRYATPTLDPLAREVAQRQRARLVRAAASTRRERPPSCWAHVPLDELFVAAGNRVYTRANGRQETGHGPSHASKSGRCIEIDPARGYWWCRGCRQGGDAVAAVRSLRGLEYRAAVAYLVQHYGRLPHDAADATGAGRRPAYARARVRKLVVEVGPCA